MAQSVSIKLSRFDSQPWGFRLQGGKDFGQPLAVQKVNGNSLAEKAGLQAGDAVLKVNDVDVFGLSHKEAQNAIVRAGNAFQLVVQRGGSTWRPTVTPVGPSPGLQSSTIQPVTQTSLAYNKPAPTPIGSQHNVAAKPFGAQVNGDTAKNLASKLYNSPVGLYSEETIAETLSAQTEVLAGGVLGVNFKKNEKTYNAANSEVLKMVQEIDKEPREPEPAEALPPPVSAPTTPKVTAPAPHPLSGLRHVAPPETKPETDPLKILPPGQNICADCERLIVGLFVRIKDKNLHVECFKCATCGTSLKNVGYYNISNKLYCDVHAKLIARQNPPAPNLEPVTIPAGVKPPASVISSALASGTATGPGSPLPGTLGPLPFHAGQTGIRHVSAPRTVPYHPQGGVSAPKVSAPTYAPAPAFTPAPAFAPAPAFTPAPAPAFTPAPVYAPAPSTVPAARPLSDDDPSGGMHYQSFSTVVESSYANASQNVSFESSSTNTFNASQQSFESSQSSFESKATQSFQGKKLSLCSQEIGTMHMDTQNVVKRLSEILDEQDRCPSPTPIDEAVKRNAQPSDTQVSREEELQKIEQQQQWKNYQSEELVNKHLQVRESGLAFLRSHSTPVSELEELYEQQQREIESQQQIIQKLGVQKRMSIDETQIKNIEGQIMEFQNEIIQRQEKQKEIEKKKRVHFEAEEQLRRGSLQQQTSLVEQQEQKILGSQARSEIEEFNTRTVSQGERSVETSRQSQQEQLGIQSGSFLSVDAHHDRSRTPVAELEAYDRHENMSRKTETIFHTYEHLIQDEKEDVEKEEVDAKHVRPVTPVRGVSPFPGSIPGAEISLLFKNIHGIESEFELKSPKKPEPKKFKLPDLRNLGSAKPYTPIPSATPNVPQSVVETPEQSYDMASLMQPLQTLPQPLPPVLQPLPPLDLGTTPVQVQAQPQIEEPCSNQCQAQKRQLLDQQIKEQRKQVHEELALNERFRRKQERLGVPPQVKSDRPKTPVAEFEEEIRHGEATERTKHVSESYDQVIQTERPRSRIGQPTAENQSITEAEKNLFFQNISGINYEFENITELTATKHLPETQKSLFIRDVEHRTQSPLTIGVNDFGHKPLSQWAPSKDVYQSPFVQALTTMPDPKPVTQPMRSLPQRTETLSQNQGIGTNKPTPSPLITALTIAPDRPYSPLPTLPVLPPMPEPEPVQIERLPSPPPQPVALPPLSVEFLPESDTGDLNDEIPKYDGGRRRSSGFPGVNVQRTPYQMLRGSQLQNVFETELKSQETAISQFTSQSSESTTTVLQRDAIVPGFGLVPASPQIAYAPPPNADKRAELVASQAKFGPSVEMRPDPPKVESKPLQRPISMLEALTIAPDRSYSPFTELRKPQATLVKGGASVALTKSVENAQKTVVAAPPQPVEIKPIYEVRDVQLNKNIIKGDATGFSTEGKEKSAEKGVIQGSGITGSYQRQEEKSFSTLQLQKVDNKSVQESTQRSEPPAPASFPPVSDQLKAEYSQLKQSAASEKSSMQSEQVQDLGGVVKTTKKRVTESFESSHKEFTQVRVIGGVDPVSGLRRTSAENVVRSAASSFQPVAASGLQKPSSIPSYQSFLSEFQPDPLPFTPASVAESKDFTPRPKSAIAGRVTKPEPEKTPLAFRSRTPVPLPKINYLDNKAQTLPTDFRNKNIPTYNQDQVYRSASPRPLSIPKPSSTGYAGIQPQSTFLKPTTPTVFRSTSPVPLPKMVKTSESYQQPISSWRVEPVKNEKRVSWPPKEAIAAECTPAPIPVSIKSVQTATKTKEVQKQVVQQQVQKQVVQQQVQKQVVQQQVQKQTEIRQSTSSSNLAEDEVLPPGSVKAKIIQQEQQAQQNLEEARRSSVVGVKAMSSLEQIKRQSVDLVTKTDLHGKAYPAPKSDPIIAPRPFGTPTPQRKIATPHFQPITPVAITEGPNTQISAPKLTFSSSSQGSVGSVQRKTSVTLASSAASAFAPVDIPSPVVPVKPVPCKPTPAPARPVPQQQQPDSTPDAGGAGGRGATFGATNAPRRGRGVLNPPSSSRIPLCAQCNGQVRGPFITALGKIWCPDHFVCNTPSCRRALADIGFVEEQGQLYCEFCFEKYLAPNCDKCNSKIKGDCLNAIGKHFHPECFSCAYCGKHFGNAAFFLEDGLPYCEADWNELFTTKCFACGFPIEAGDRWVEALNNNYHSQCFNCNVCKKNLEGQSFFAKGGRPFCKAHAR